MTDLLYYAVEDMAYGTTIEEAVAEVEDAYGVTVTVLPEPSGNGWPSVRIQGTYDKVRRDSPGRLEAAGG